MEDSIALQYVPKQEMDDDANLFNTSINPPYATGLSTSTISAMHPNDPNAASGHPMVSSMHPAGFSSTPSNPWGHSSAPHHHDGFASANAYGYPLDDRATTYVAQSQTGPVQDAMNGLPPISSVNSMSLPVPSSTATLPLTSAALSSVSRPTSTLHSPVHEGFGSLQQAFGPEGYNRPEPAIRNDSFPRTDSFPRIDMLSKNESLARARSRALSYSGPYGLPGQAQQVSGFHTSPTEYAPQILPPLHTQQLASPYHSQAPSPISQHPPPTHALSPLHHQAMLSQQQAYHSQAQAQPMAAPLNHIPHPQNHTHSSAFYLEEGGQLSNAPQGAGVNSSGHPHLYTPPTPLTSAASTHVQPNSAAALSSSAVIDATANLASVTPSSSAIGGSSASTSGSPASITAVNNTSPSAFAGSNSFHASGTGPTILGASSGTGTPPGMGTNGHSAAAPPPPVVPLSGVVTPTSALSPTSAATVMSTATSSLNSSLPPPIPPLNASIGTGGPPSIPRSMSLNSIPSSGTHSGASTPFHITSGRATPSGIFGASSASGGIPPPSRLGRMGVPSIMIPASNLSMSASSLNSAPVATGMYVDTNQAYQFTHQDYMYGPGSAVVSPSTPMILSSLLRGSASGPGTASNGGSVPLTPINDDGVHNFDYHLSTRMNGLDMGSTPSSMGGMVGSGMHTSMVGGMNGMNEMPMGGMHVTMNGGPVHDDMDGIEEDEDEDDEDMYYGNSANPNVLTMASRSRSTSALNMALSNGSTASLVGGGGSPRRSNVSGVERTQKKRRSATIAAGPSAAAVGASRSRSGTLIGGNHPPTMIGANGLPIPASMMGMGGVMGNPALAFSPIDSMPPAVSNGAVGPQSTQLNPSLGMPNNNTNGVNGVTVAAGVGVGGQANSPLAMKELSASMKSVIEGYLLRYLNYLCMNQDFHTPTPRAKGQNVPPNHAAGTFIRFL
ncbi:hypothetical protein CPB86DRAFT_339568 [Serendipita vermifera]|nr:hypothetical protein CPB86DRAFT_339568 [Serendipita vermifera]